MDVHQCHLLVSSLPSSETPRPKGLAAQEIDMLALVCRLLRAWALSVEFLLGLPVATWELSHSVMSLLWSVEFH